jgi:hypothetical protein
MTELRGLLWRVQITAPDGRSDMGAFEIFGDVEVPRERIAEALAEIAWRIAMDLAAVAPPEGDDG